MSQSSVFAPAPDEPVSLLLACHDRIRRATRGVLTLSEGSLGRAEYAALSASVVRYFEEALPHHRDDEEISVVPRLLGRSPDVDAALALMIDEHRAHEPILSGILRSLRDHEAPSKEAAQLLSSHFQSHLEAEERVIFPALDQLLQPEDRDRLLREMRARRRAGQS